MREMIIESRGKYSYQDKNGNRSNITAKQAWSIFTEWKKDGKKIQRNYIMGGRVAQVWPED